MLTTRDTMILSALEDETPYARVSQLAELIVPSAKDGTAIIRSRLRVMEAGGLVRRYNPKLIDPFDPQTQAPIWVISVRGSHMLARLTDAPSRALLDERSFADWM